MLLSTSASTVFAPQTIPLGGPNLVVNPDFEVNTTGWAGDSNGTSSTIARTTAQHNTGIAACAVTANTNGLCRTTPNTTGITVGFPYTASAFVKANTVARGCTITLKYYTAGDGNLTSFSSTPVFNNVNGWIQISVSGLVPATAAKFSIEIDAASIAAGEIYFVDTASMSLGGTSGVSQGLVYLGPGLNGARGPATWTVNAVTAQTSRPKTAPIPSFALYLNSIASGQSQLLTDDGSYYYVNSANIFLIRGQYLIGVWTGGSVGDVGTLVLSGTKE